ncbi:hypothetical protein HYFRA_00000636 [Hymenoscyphus fraxineus]|uniref:Zn(2)-C6 fungal-type domain-containing protein n=1 Tax=Hymenoscyphus fraxineus TaxID=746836 RepID=A0A9N9PSP7_9HELO|nr:hypothetical protein HYFRA_00000636 [Hymenoscyphus fraxineus]
MVFCGKPSGGCHACRARKTRCDKIDITEGGCTQCKRAKRTCPGYRIAGELMFRDESSNVVRKFKATEARHKKALAGRRHFDVSSSSIQSTLSSPRVSESDQEEKYQSDISVTSPQVLQQDQLSLSYSLAPNLEDRATSFFAFHYIMDPKGPSKPLMDRATDLFQNQHLDESLLASMRAVGLAAYSHTAHAPSLMNNAKYQYLRAIQFTNAAIRNPEDVKKDSTLMAIQILAIFETVTGCRQRSLKDWIEHVYGAAAVIRLRGPEQVQTLGGRRLLLHAVSNILINCVYRGIRLPEHLREYLFETFKQSAESRLEYLLMDVMVRFADLRAGVQDGSVTGLANILSSVLEMDSVLLKLCTNPPPGWEYETILTDAQTDVIFDGRYHIYSDHLVALMWNWLRTLRIMLNGMIREILLNGFSATPPLFTQVKYTAQFQTATETIFALQGDILASVPQHVGRGNPPRSMATQAQSDNNEEVPSITMSEASSLIWPLWFAGNMANATDQIREFTLRILHSIGDIQGVRQAHVLANLLQTKSAIRVWDVQRETAHPSRSALLIQDSLKTS